MRRWVLGAAVLASGCGEGESGDPNGDVEGPTFTLNWTSTGLEITIAEGVGEVEMGLVDTDPLNPQPWTGEDCYYGYTTEDGTTYRYCHPLASTGGALQSGGDPLSLEPGTQTVFDWNYGDTLTYLFMDSTSCWVMGHDPTWYDGMGCTVR